MKIDYLYYRKWTAKPYQEQICTSLWMNPFTEGGLLCTAIVCNFFRLKFGRTMIILVNWIKDVILQVRVADKDYSTSKRYYSKGWWKYLEHTVLRNSLIYLITTSLAENKKWLFRPNNKDKGQRKYSHHKSILQTCVYLLRCYS